jgi:hypothetical protein
MKKEIKKKPKELFIIENKISSPKWKIKYPSCRCSVKDLGDCKFCHYTKAEDSIPKEITTTNLKDSKGEIYTAQVIGVKLIHGSDENVIGWQELY